jgi:hypothetical protein
VGGGRRIRVTEALDVLPAIEQALATGELSYSAVRELTRIATAKTEEAWLDACEGKNQREIEELVAEREHGDAPTDDPKPDVRPQRVSMMLRPAVGAALRSARQAIEAARGERIDDSELIEELCRGYLVGTPEKERGTADGAGGAPRGPRAQIAITTCETCSQAWQHAAGRKIAISEAEYETAACDARFIGALDKPDRAKNAVPPATERAVRQRDGYRCTVPGCRSARFLHVHHIVWRSRCGGHEMENLTTLCGGHHGAVHRGEIVIMGKAPAIVVTRTFKVPHVGDLPVTRSAAPTAKRAAPTAGAAAPVDGVQRDAVLALTTLGAAPPEAERAVAAGRARVGPDATLEAVVREALRECRW